MGTKDALKIIKKRLEKKPELKKTYLEEKRNLFIACKIREYRKHAKLTQKELAELINTTQSVISRLEHAEYKGHSLTILEKISSALNVPLENFLESNNAKNTSIKSENSSILFSHVPPITEEAVSFKGWNSNQIITKRLFANARS